MTAASPASERRRPRPGSVERPVNGRLYRGAWVLVALPVLLLAFSVSRPTGLQQLKNVPVFDGIGAAVLARDLASHYPDRVPGTPGAAGAAKWFVRTLQPYGYKVHRDTFTATVQDHAATLVNLIAVKPGISPREIVVMAHRDDSGTGHGLDDNASGTAVLVALARAYAPSRTVGPVGLPYTLAFVSTDGAEEGALGAARFAADPSTRKNVVAVIDLDSVGGDGHPRLEFAGDTARSPAPGLLETLQVALQREPGVKPTRPGALDQLMGFAFPFTPYEQGPFVSAGIPAVTLTTGLSRPDATSTTRRLNTAALSDVGLATQDSVNAMEQGVALEQGPSSYLFLGQRVIRGWAIELVLVAMLLPFIAASVDLFARCRRRRIPIAPALRSYRSRLVFWLCGGIAFLVFSSAEWLGNTGGRPGSLNGVTWPIGALLVLALLGLASWLVVHDRLRPWRPVETEEELAGHTAALLALSVVSLLVAATNPYALIILLPSLHVWLWLPQVHARPRIVRALVLALGLVGPAYLVWTFAARYGLGWDAPWYIAQLFVSGYAPKTLFVIGLAWLAAAAQLVALVGGRYTPYPEPGERSPRGPIRELIRMVYLAQRRRAAVMARSGGARKRPSRP